MTGAAPGSTNPCFRSAISQGGGISKFTNKLLRHVDPLVLGLQGKQLTPQCLDEVRSKQSNLWSSQLGYLDYITDSRCQAYLRAYVGQSEDGYSRIFLEHTQAILQGKNDTLHYFIPWIGNGYRSANFIKLWELKPDSYTEYEREAVADILETLFCLFFQTISEPLLLSGHCQPQSGSSFGLNVVPPLYQHQRITQSEKAPFTFSVSKSTDPQVKAWADRRRPRQSRRRDYSKMPRTKDDYTEALKNTISDVNIFGRVESSLNSGSHNTLSQEDFEDEILNPPYGNFDAPIAFVLDHPVSFHDPESSASTDIPWALQQSGFNQSNALVWTFDFGNFAPSPDEMIRRVSAEQHEMLQAMNMRLASLDAAQKST